MRRHRRQSEQRAALAVHGIDDGALQMRSMSDLLVGQALQAAFVNSPLVHRVLSGRSGSLSARYIQQVTRGPLTFARGDSILVSRPGQRQTVAVASEIAVIGVNGQMDVYLYLRDCRTSFEEDDSGGLLVPVASKPSCSVVALYSVSVTLLLKCASPDAGQDRFRYVF